MKSSAQSWGSSRLHGREAELQALRLALRPAEPRVAVARGPAGVGKTALARAVLEEARENGALVGAGKYDEGHVGRDLEPVIGAIEDAVACGLEHLFDPEGGLRDLARALGSEAHVLAGVGSGLLRTLAPVEPSRPPPSEGADEQLARALSQVLQWLGGFGAPTLLLIDDWGRAGLQARRMLRRLLTDPRLAHVRVLATERADEAFPSIVPTSIVAVGALPERAQLDLVCELLGDRAGAAGDVLAYLGPVARNPFELIEAVRALLGADAILWRAGAWRLDPARAAASLGGEITRVLVDRVLEGEPEAAGLTRLLAVHGDGAEPGDLAAAAGLAPTEAGRLLTRLAQIGLAAWSGGRVGFSHDRLRAEVLLGLAEDERRGLAARLADALRARGAAPGETDRGMRLLWLRQEAGLDVADPHAWRDAFVLGAFRARQVGDRDAADRFASAALQLAEAGAGVTYALLLEAAFAAIIRGDDAEARGFADRMTAYASTPVDRAVAHEMRVFARRVAGDLDAALEVAREALAEVGVHAPLKVTPGNLVRAVVRIFAMDPRRAVAPLPPDRLAVEGPIIRALNGIGSLLFERDPLLAVVFATQSVSPDVAYGTAAGAGTYTLLSCAVGDYRRAAAWAEASDRLQGAEQPLRAIARQYSSSFGHVFVQPRRRTRTRGDDMAALAYAGGDLAVAAYGNRDKVLDSLFGDDVLAATEAMADEAVQVAERIGDPPTVPHTRALRQFIKQIREGGASAWRLDGEFFDLAASMGALQAERMANVARAVGSLEALLSVLYGRDHEAMELAQRPWPRFAPTPFQAQTQIWNFAIGLAGLRTGRGRLSALARWNLRRLGRLNPQDFLHRWLLLKAEAARAAGRRARALSGYALAIEAAAGSHCLLEQGLVCAVASEGAASLGAAREAHDWAGIGAGAWRRLGAEALIAARFPNAAPSPPEAETSEATEDSDRISRARARLLAAIGHELRTPLQGALALVELAERPGEGADLADVRDAIEGLAGVVGDLTDLGALEGGVVPVRLAPMDARATARSVAALHAAVARSRGRELVFATPGEPIWVEGDAGRVRQILGNLTANALRHGVGAVHVGVAPAEGDRVRYWVSDEGPTFSPGDLIRIFEPFKRGEGRADETGLGVGLFLSRRIAQALGGDLAVVQTPSGKAFEFEIPAAPAASTGGTVGVAPGLRVLLAEDAELGREALAALLRREGCQVTQAADGLSAISALGDAVFDLLLLDQQMPGASGVEVAAAAQSLNPLPRVVLMTASSDEAVVRAARQAGVDQVLTKPVSVRRLRAEPDPPTAGDRLDALRRALGAEAEPLIGALDDALETELSALEACAASGDPKRFDAQRHRLRGLAAHFGVDDVVEALSEGVEPVEAVARVRDSLRRRREAASQA